MDDGPFEIYNAKKRFQNWDDRDLTKTWGGISETRLRSDWGLFGPVFNVSACPDHLMIRMMGRSKAMIP